MLYGLRPAVMGEQTARDRPGSAQTGPNKILPRSARTAAHRSAEVLPPDR